MFNEKECKKALEHLIECKQRKLCGKCSFKTKCTMTSDELVIENLIEQHFQLVKALDKACEELETFDMTFNDGDFVDIKNKEQWKEWLKENVE